MLEKAEKDSIDYEIARNATIKSFELTLETCGKLLRKIMKPFFATSKQADQLTFKELFRHAVKHGLLEPEVAERWFEYRDNRNNTAHDYGESFAELTVKLIPKFLVDATLLRDKIHAQSTAD
jgi:nucleotidyltransferase substrate binding protein (TIGR01987 family)